MRISIFLFFLVILGASLSLAQNTFLNSPSGLEVPPNSALGVLTESLPEEARNIGLSEDIIQAKVELQLRRNAIPLPRDDQSNDFGFYLYINCGVLGKAFSATLALHRKVFYEVNGKIYQKYASTYDRSITGTYGGDSDFIIKAILDMVDLFSNDFLKANPHFTK